jgi:2-oxoisovalerate ferredoxin oxidoreductase beta subunit
MLNYKVIHQKPATFYARYERKSDLPERTHFCPGCGHGITLKLLAEAIDDLGIRDRVILISPVGCAVLLYYYFDVGNVQVAHGRAPAAATALKRARPEAIVISFQGDGDLGAIGAAEILHAANRDENITVIFANNAIYGMTGGQLAPTTPIGDKSTTCPFGRDALNDGYPLHVSEVLAQLEAPAFIERVGVGSAKQVLMARKAIRKALENQIQGLGFSLIEVLTPCPTAWKMDPVDAQRHVRDVLTKVYPLGVYCNRVADRKPRPARPPAPALAELPRLLDLVNGARPTATRRREGVDFRLKIAGFGGQGVLLLGQLMAEAGMDDGLEVSWLPSYGPEMRSGTSNCQVRLSSAPIDSPLISKPNVLVAMNEPSLLKFAPTLEPGALVIYNSNELPADCRRKDVRYIVRPFAEIADTLGSAKVMNIVILGALVEATKALPAERVDGALRRLVKSEKWLALDRQALAKGRAAIAAESRGLS